MAGLTITTADSILKELYDDQKVEEMVYQDFPFLAMLKKKEDFYGRNYPLPIRYARPQGRSKSFSTARTNKTASKFEQFTLTRVKDYGAADLAREALLAAESDRGAFIRTAMTEMDGMIENVGEALAIDLFGNGSGSRGRISAGSNVSSDTITLTDINDIVNFEIGMVLESDDAEGGGTVKSGQVTIESLDRDAGTITVEETTWDDAGGIATVAASDYLFVQDDYDAAISGLRAWLPTTAPGSTAFFGVDRSVDPTRLGGVRYDGSSDALEEVFTKAAARLVRNGGRPDVCFVNPIKFADLELSLGDKVRYEKVQARNAQGVVGHIGFTAIEVTAQHGGTIKVVADPKCPSTLAFMLTFDDWCFYSLKAAPHIFTEGDGLTWLRNRTEDSLEVLGGYYGQLGCSAPGRSAVITLPT